MLVEIQTFNLKWTGLPSRDPLYLGYSEDHAFNKREHRVEYSDADPRVYKTWLSQSEEAELYGLFDPATGHLVRINDVPKECSKGRWIGTLWVAVYSKRQPGVCPSGFRQRWRWIKRGLVESRIMPVVLIEDLEEGRYYQKVERYLQQRLKSFFSRGRKGSCHLTLAEELN